MTLQVLAKILNAKFPDGADVMDGVAAEALLALAPEMRRLREALEEQLLGGQHEGSCDNEDGFEPGPCSLHVAAARKRDEHARTLLAELG